MAPNRPQERQQRGTPLSDAQEDILKSVTDHEPDDDSNSDIRRNEDDAGDDDDDDTAPVAEPDDDDDDDVDEPDRRREPDDDDEEPDQQRRRKAADADDDEPDPDKNFQYKQNRNGDILDIDGKILFAKGRSRNAWTKLKKAYRVEADQKAAVVQHAQHLASVGTELLNKYRALQKTANKGEKLGLTDKETSDALDLAALAKRDPKGAVKTILTRLSLGGTDLSDIGVTGPVDAKEVARHVVEQQELARQTQETARYETAKAAAKETLQNFLIANPTASRYLGMITKAKTDWPHLSLEQIWDQLTTAARKAAKRRGNGRDDDPDRRRNFREPPPRNNRRDHRDGQKLSLKAVDPAQSFKKIGSDLLADLQRMEKD